MRFFPQSTRSLVLTLMAFNAVVLLGMVLLGGRALDSVAREEEHKHLISTQSLESVYQLNLALEHEGAALRGYLLTGREGMRRSFEEGRSDFLSARARLAPLLAPKEQVMLAELEATHGRYLDYAARLIELHGQGKSQQVLSVFLDTGRPLRRTLSTQIERLVTAKKQDIAAIQKEVKDLERKVKWQMALAALIAVPISVALSVFTAFRVVMPLQALEAAALAMAGGALGTRVKGCADDEFGRVGRAFNAMAEQVEQSHNRLVAANEDLVRADQVKDEFLSVVSHELRTPLTVIMGFGRMLEGGMAGPLSPPQTQYMGKMLGSADRMLQLINDLLDYAKLQHGQLELTPRAVAFDELVDEVVSAMRPLATVKAIALTAEVAVSGSIVLDGKRVVQVLTNLVGNAVKFVPEGGHIAIRAVVRADRIVTEVVDSGPGIAPENVEKLFKRFSQLDMSATRQAGGTGLGLSISKAIVEAHGGAIGVESTLHQGSTFWFELPYQAAASGSLQGVSNKLL